MIPVSGLPSLAPGETLSVLLEGAGHPLNTRCGGRGLCSGCRVVLHTAQRLQEHRACQLPADDLPDDLRVVEIPAASRRDATLHGVTAFELRHPAPSPPVRPADALTFPRC